ncbi:Csu type fimbrial protein [Neisseria animaloris]|uniref:Csu type fimbrial protein n=1 Tax=Neisseria animaloris TaxID=326522 RepID=UPI000D3A9114|nr:spore coat U domain-containing protein [Neisseria animaloris]
MHTVKKLSTLTSIMAALLCSGTAMADSKSTDFHVTIRIMPVCEVTTSTGGAPNELNSTSSAGADINFGDHASNHGSNVDGQSVGASQGAIQVTCTKDTPYRIALTPASTGQSTGIGNMKGLTGGASINDEIAYTLYQDADRQQVWGSQDGVNTKNSSGKGMSTPDKYPVYGRVLGNQFNKPAGRYSDRVNVTVHY